MIFRSRASVMSPVIYRIDCDDRIVGVNEGWHDFARNNAEGLEVADEKVVGSELWSAISDATIQHLYRLIVDRARAGKLVRFHYRCDAPGFRRLFEMSVERVGSDVVFTSTLQSEEPRKPVVLLEANRTHGAERSACAAGVRKSLANKGLGSPWNKRSKACSYWRKFPCHGSLTAFANPVWPGC